MDTLEIARTIVESLEDKKGENIILMDIHEQAIFADYFVICTGTSDRMPQALADSAVEQVKKKFQLSARVEGASREGWVLVDFGDVLLHLFSPDRRDYYRLEDLWSQAKILLHLQ